MAANFGKYMRFIARRERVAGLVWMAALVLFLTAMAAIFPGLFPTQEALVSMAATLDTPAMAAMIGPVYGLDRISPAIAMAQECLLWTAVAAMVMNILFVNRHTRADEELGRQEMLAALPVGRLAGSAATLACAFALDAAISLFAALGILAVNIEGITAAGAFCYAFSIGTQGFLFAAVTLLTAQLFSTARGSMGAAFSVLGVSYVLRAAGDMAGNALSVISPMGLGLKVQAFYTDAFWPVAALFLEAVVITAAALILHAKRDVGAGVFAARKGRTGASRLLQSPFGFAWRLSRGSFLAWAIAFTVLGAMYGTVVGEIDSFAEGNDMIRQLLTAQGGGAGSLAEAYLPMLCGTMALLASVPVIGTVSRLRSEEKRGRIEQIFACAVPRASIFGSFVAIAAAEAILFSFLSAFGLYVTSQGTGCLSFGTIMGASFVYVPAIFTLAGLTAFLVGCFPKLTAFVWALFGYSFFLLYFERLFDVPEWAAKISPFGNVPGYPVQELAAAPLTVLCVAAAALSAAGYLAGYRRRDVRA
ncbi:MAG: hypothetical protein LBQ15_04550 [Clostridium sp.]|jgi:ABC-2 type transport system permease protein|nr:hypothetical protein [Clostridium sp.]